MVDESLSKPPEIISGKYKILDLIGEGKTARVYRTTMYKSTNSQELALKWYPEVYDRIHLKRIEREIKVGMKVKNDHLVPIIDYGIEGAHQYICMPLIEGDTLKEIIKRKDKLTQLDIIKVMRDCALALKSLHDAGICHRDIHPGNIMVKNNHTLVMDFGLAIHQDDSHMTPSFEIVGARRYTAPEVLFDLGWPQGPLSDLWSLGACMHHLLIGQPLYGNAKKYGDYFYILRHMGIGREAMYDLIETTDDRGYDVRIAYLVARLLAIDPSERLHSAGELIRASSAFLSCDCKEFNGVIKDSLNSITLLKTHCEQSDEGSWIVRVDNQIISKHKTLGKAKKSASAYSEIYWINRGINIELRKGEKILANIHFFMPDFGYYTCNGKTTLWDGSPLGLMIDILKQCDLLKD